MPRIGVTELIIILVVVLLIFGAGKLPEVGGAMGRGIREFRRALRSGGEEREKALLQPEETSKR